jgi:periplasmic protein CpxP/Spy
MDIRPVSNLTVLVLMGTAIALTFPAPVPGFSLAPTLAQAPAKLQQQELRGWLRELNLSTDQLQQIRQIRNQYQGRLTQQRQAVQQGQQELKQLMAGNASTEQVRQKFEQVQRLREELQKTRMESMLAIRKVLNPEQRQKLAELMKQRGNRFGEP